MKISKRILFPKRKLFFKKIGDYFNIMAAGLYRSDRSDQSIQPSNVSFFGNVSTSGFYMLGIRGSHILPKDKYRLLYTVYFYSMPSDYWGIGYDAGSNDSFYWSYLRLQAQMKTDFLFKLSHNLFFGPMVSFDFVKGNNFKKKNPNDPRTVEQIIAGEKSRIGTTGIGASVVYDSRDVITDCHNGIYFKIEQGFYPKFLGNKYDFMMTDIIFDTYNRVWKGGILAFDLHGKFNYGNVPWTMKSRMGGQFRMRGYYEGQYRDRNVGEIQVELRQHVWKRNGVVFYYEGQYRDNNLIEVQLELRQHLWKRNGMVLWVGAGNVFENFRKFNFSETLPNFGIGYRWEFKSRVNVRLDLGFGKDFKTGFMFNINEAF